ncbi:MAG: hypothetical protein KGI83_06860, partial [Verrucomicrobiota bacterium]|nr:hypothetical protein [Verrucomicrobiota bacterium]
RECITSFYTSFLMERSAFGIWAQAIMTHLNECPKDLEKLDISIPPAEMLAIYSQYGIIALRKLEHSTLTLFCGNRPVYSSALEHVYTPNERRHHAHAECDTLDYDPWMNSSVITCWPPHPKTFPYFAKRYTKVEGECMTAVTKENRDQSLRCLAHLLQDEGTCPGNPYTFQGSDIELQKRTLNASAMEAGFTVTYAPLPKRDFGPTCQLQDFTVTFVKSKSGGHEKGGMNPGPQDSLDGR